MNAQEREAALERFRAGNQTALGELLESYRPYVRVLVRAERGGRAPARLDDSDLVQDVLLEVQQSLGDFRGRTAGELTARLRRVVLCTVRRALRGLFAGKRDPAREKPGDDLALAADTDDAPLHVVVRHEQAARMACALGRLSDEEQQVLLGRHLEGATHAELASRIGRSEGAVRMLYLRALRRLRDVFGDE
jgi:RNA polymerase sigma-70 factor (ECF subfamily)